VVLRSLVARDRLADVFRAAGRRRLILINVPSGYGKSTLAAQWRELRMREGVAVAWLTVDDDDNNAVWFLAHLLESIRMIRPALAASLAQVLEEHGDDSARYVLTSLIDEIHHNDDRITLVVDEWHRVSDSQTTAALGFLLEHGCHHLQLIMTSWSHGGSASPCRAPTLRRWLPQRTGGRPAYGSLLCSYAAVPTPQACSVGMRRK